MSSFQLLRLYRFEKGQHVICSTAPFSPFMKSRSGSETITITADGLVFVGTARSSNSAHPCNTRHFLTEEGSRRDSPRLKTQATPWPLTARLWIRWSCYYTARLGIKHEHEVRILLSEQYCYNVKAGRLKSSFSVNILLTRTWRMM
jgi:hypothetical protein